MSVDILTLARERDFLLRLLHLVEHDKPTALVQDALRVAMCFCSARAGFLELARDDRTLTSATDGLDIGAVRALLASGTFAAALDDGQIAIAVAGSGVALPVDRQPSDTDEVAVCVPIGHRPRDGVLYLDGVAPALAREHLPLWNLFGRQLASLAPRIFRHVPTRTVDPTKAWRARLGGAEGLVGASQVLADALKAAASAAVRDVAVLVTGPHGSGKTTLAQLIAHHGSRAGRPIVAVDGARVEPTLLDAELFGTPGDQSGKVLQADGGTLLIDEIAHLTPLSQAKLLQLLSDGSFYVPGSNRAERVDARLIATTRFDLAALVRQGTFREDLFYRLCVIEIPMPTLEERRIDIAELAEHFLREAVTRLSLPGVLGWSSSALRALETARWPGNLRQLGSVVEGAAVRAHAEGAATVESAHAFPNHRDPDARSTFQAMTRGYQRQVLGEALARHHGNVSEAAAALGLGRSSLYQLIKNLGVERS